MKSDWPSQVGGWADEWNEDLVRFLSRRTVTVADAEDLAQEVYLRLLRIDRADLVRTPRSYLLRIAANLLHEWRLKARQARPHDDTDELDGQDELTAESSPELEVAAALRSRRLAAELARLPPAVRAALVLQIRDGLSYQEIAARMRVTPRMVKRYLLTAYARLRARVPPDL